MYDYLQLVRVRSDKVAATVVMYVIFLIKYLQKQSRLTI